MRMVHLVVLVVLMLCGPGRPGSADTLDAFVEEQLKRYQVPGLSLAVIEGGRIVRARGFGVTEKGGRTLVTPRTLFQAGSVSKPVAALGVLRLVEQKRLALDEDVNQRFTTWKVPENDLTRTKKVTLRGLLTHSAGLTVHGFPGYEMGTPVPTLVQVLDGVKPANTAPVRVDQVPGTGWRYSGGGYTVMQLLAQDVTGQPFDAYLRKAVLEPLGMSESTYEQPLPEPLRSTAATGHYPDGRLVPGRWHVYPEMAAAGLWTSPSDLARFVIGVQQAYAGKPGAQLSGPTAREMLTPQIGGWGLGPAVAGAGREVRFSHGGRDEGFDAELVGYAETGQGAVVMINANENRGLLRRVLAAIAKQYRWPGYPIPPEYRAIPDNDPKVATVVKQVFTNFQQEKLDREVMTPELARRLSPELPRFAVALRQLGALGMLTLVERKDEHGERLHRYRVNFEQASLLVLVRTNREGKLASFTAEAE